MAHSVAHSATLSAKDKEIIKRYQDALEEYKQNPPEYYEDMQIDWIGQDDAQFSKIPKKGTWCIFTNNKSARDGLGFLTHVWVAQLERKRGKIVPGLACQASSLSYNLSFEMWDGSELDYWAHIPADAYLQDMARIVKIAKGDYRVATEKEERRRQHLWNLFQQMESHTHQHGLEFPFSKTKLMPCLGH